MTAGQGIVFVVTFAAVSAVVGLIVWLRGR